MAKSLKLKCLTDAHLEKHDLPDSHKGKIGVFDGEELIGVADAPEGWEPKGGDGDGTEAAQDQFAALSESIHDGKINLAEAGKLADAGRVRFSTILQAQEAERKVNAAVKAGKVLPKNRAHARLGSTLVIASHSLPAGSFAAMASTRGKLMSPCL